MFCFACLEGRELNRIQADGCEVIPNSYQVTQWSELDGSFVAITAREPMPLRVAWQHTQDKNKASIWLWKSSDLFLRKNKIFCLFKVKVFTVRWTSPLAMEKVTKFWICQGFCCMNSAFPFPLPCPLLCSWPPPSELRQISVIPFISHLSNFQLLSIQNCFNWWRTAPQIVPVKWRPQHAGPSCVPEQGQPVLWFWEARGAALEVGWWCCCKEL